MSKVTLSPEVRETLERSTITSTSVTLPSSPRLERKLYQDVNKVLEAAGGKWSKKEQAHVFPSDPRAALGLAIQTGGIVDAVKARKKERQAFYTPEVTANTLACLADIDGQVVLEPSAGGGALVKAARSYGAKEVYSIEIDADCASSLSNCITADFLKCHPRAPDVPEPMRRLFERIVMNPPFTRKSDLKHVMHAFNHWLPLGGLLTAIVADDGHDRQDILHALRGSGSTFTIKERLPNGTFKESGTQIATLIIQICK